MTSDTATFAYRSDMAHPSFHPARSQTSVSASSLTGEGKVKLDASNAVLILVDGGALEGELDVGQGGKLELGA